MRNTIFVIIGLCLPAIAGVTCYAQEKKATIDSVVNPATIPSDGNFKAHPGWNIRCAERVGALAGKTCDALFIGDSITQNFSEDKDGNWNITDGLTYHFAAGERGFDLTGRAVWNTYFKGRNCLDFGVGADGTEHILWRMDRMDIRQFKPKIVVILAGTNDMKFTAAQIAGGIKAVLDKAKELFPDAHILLMSLTPRATLSDKIIAVNDNIKAFADNNKVFYIDLYRQMPPDGNFWLGIGHDHVHLTPQGYELWAKAIEPMFQKFIPGH